MSTNVAGVTTSIGSGRDAGGVGGGGGIGAGVVGGVGSRGISVGTTAGGEVCGPDVAIGVSHSSVVVASESMLAAIASSIAAS